MEAKDTVMSDEQIEVLKQEAEKLSWSHKAHPSYEKEKYLLAEQAELSFTAGIKEVIDWIISHKKGYYQKPSGELIAVISAQWTEEEWQSKLKEWGIDVK